MKITIGRTSGPCTDRVVSATFDDNQAGVIQDVLAMVNKASNDKESWFVEIDGTIIIPVATDDNNSAVGNRG